jgi:hypothetical protein
MACGTDYRDRNRNRRVTNPTNPSFFAITAVTRRWADALRLAPLEISSHATTKRKPNISLRVKRLIREIQVPLFLS